MYAYIMIYDQSIHSIWSIRSRRFSLTIIFSTRTVHAYILVTLGLSKQPKTFISSFEFPWDQSFFRYLYRSPNSSTFIRIGMHRFRIHFDRTFRLVLDFPSYRSFYWRFFSSVFKINWFNNFLIYKIVITVTKCIYYANSLTNSTSNYMATDITVILSCLCNILSAVIRLDSTAYRWEYVKRGSRRQRLTDTN